MTGFVVKELFKYQTKADPEENNRVKNINAYWHNTTHVNKMHVIVGLG